MGRRRSKLQNRIASYVTSKGVFPRPVQPKEVARQLYNPINDGDWSKFYQNIRKNIQKMSKGKGPQLKHDGHGWYSGFYTLQDILMAKNPDLVIHGVVLEGVIEKSQIPNALRGSPFPSQWQRSDKPELLVPHENGEGMPLINKKNGAWSFTSSFEGRRVVVTFYQTGTLLIRCSSSKYPMTPTELSGFNGWLNGVFNNAVPSLNLYVVEIGVGYDLKPMRLEGIKAIKWGVFTNAYWEMYQKTEDMLRLALHLTIPKNELSFIDALNILQVATMQDLNIVSRAKFSGDDKKDVVRPPGYQ